MGVKVGHGVFGRVAMPGYPQGIPGSVRLAGRVCHASQVMWRMKAAASAQRIGQRQPNGNQSRAQHHRQRLT